MFQVFKGLVMGPHVMAGLTDGPRTIVADPAEVNHGVEPLSSTGRPAHTRCMHQPVSSVGRRGSHPKHTRWLTSWQDMVR